MLGVEQVAGVANDEVENQVAVQIRTDDPDDVYQGFESRCPLLTGFQQHRFLDLGCHPRAEHLHDLQRRVRIIEDLHNADGFAAQEQGRGDDVAKPLRTARHFLPARIAREVFDHERTLLIHGRACDARVRFDAPADEAVVAVRPPNHFEDEFVCFRVEQIQCARVPAADFDDEVEHLVEKFVQFGVAGDLVRARENVVEL